MRIEVRLAHERLEPSEELASFLAEILEEGAIVSFVGTARPRSRSDKRIDRLFLDHHPRLTQRSLEKIADDAAKRFDVTAVRVVHRCGEVLPCQAVVFAAAAARHRRAAFEAVDYLMDRLKVDAVFWKREEGVDGATWIDPTDQDHDDRASWNQKCPE